MVNVYNSMLTTLKLEQLLLQLGFLPQPEALCFQAGQVRVCMLDAPRLLVHSPSGVHYIAVLSEQDLAQHLSALQPQVAATATAKSAM